MVIIDSSIFIALERRGLSLDELSEGDLQEDASIAAITASELLTGVHRADGVQRALRRQSFVEAILSAVPVLAFDLRVARIHARLSADLARSGQAISAHDLQIAATAVAHNADVLTYNLREFERVPGLTVRHVSL